MTVPEPVAEAAGHILRGIGQGLVEEDGPAGRRLRVYLPAEEAEAVRAEVRGRLAALADFFPEVTVPGVPFWAEEKRSLRAEEWSERWRAFFRPVRVGRRLLVIPAWREAGAAGGRVVLRLEPGLAFGTGQHASTRLALRLLLRALRPGERVVDVGTGSGILAVAAALLGAGRVFALDVDPVAVRAAAANAALNGVGARVAVRRGELAEWPEARGEVFLANISPEVVTALAPVVAGRAPDGGRAVLAGFLAADAAAVEAAWAARGWTVRRRLQEDGWVGLLLALPTVRRRGTGSGGPRVARGLSRARGAGRF